MPFIVQCPDAACRKYMLLEDFARGTVVDCMICKKPIRVDPGASGAYAPPPGASNPSATTAPTAQRQAVANCPKCNTPLRVPAHSQSQAIKCPKCNHLFRT